MTQDDDPSTSDRRDKAARFYLPIPPGWVLGLGLVVGALGALVWADATQWHWYAADPEDGETLTELEARVSSLEQALEDTDENLAEQGAEVSDLEESIQGLRGEVIELRNQPDGGAGEFVDSPELAVMRMAGAVTILSLIESYGRPASTGSAQGEACMDWFLLGEGSPGDCGFQRIDQ